MSKASRYEINMLSGPILGRMIRFAIPLALSSILQLLFNAADVVVVGRFAGDTCLAAVGSTGSLNSLIVNLFMGLSIGTNVLAARARGAGDDSALQKVVHTSILLSFVGGLGLSVIGVIGTRQFLAWMGSPEDVIDLSALYLRIIFAGMSANMVYNFGSALLRSVGDTRRPMLILILAGVLNVCLNLFLVIVCRMDVAGVAIATVASQCLSAVLVVLCLIRTDGPLHLDLKRLHLDPAIVKDIAKIGIPACFQGMLFSISNVAIQSSVNGFGSTVMAGNSAAGNLEGFVYVGMNACYQATISFVGQNHGANKTDRIPRIVRTALLLCLGIGTLMGVGAWYFGKPLLSIYTSSPEVIAAGRIRMSYLCLPYAICGLMDTMVGALRGIGRSLAPMFVSVLGVCGLRLLWIATVCRLPSMSGIDAIYMSYPISWTVTLIAHTVCFLIAFKKIRREAIK